MPATAQASLLIVEDDDIDREAILRSLRRSKIANPVTTATDGQAALEILRSGEISRPLVILLDWKMPRMDGPGFLDALRSDPNLADLPVIVLTTSDDEHDIARAYERHVAGYILKESAGPDFVEVVTLLDAYWRIVELPHHQG